MKEEGNEERNGNQILLKSKIQKILINLLLLSLGVIFCLSLFEIYLRFIPLRAEHVTDLWVDNFEFQYSVHLNSDYFRDDEFHVEKAPNTFRILLIGDSFVYGAGVSTESTLDKILEKKLNSWNPPLNYEVYNLGINGTDPTQYYELAKQFQKYNPDYVIVSLYVDNDIHGHGWRNHFRFIGWKESIKESLQVLLWKKGISDCIFLWLKDYKENADPKYYRLACEGKMNPHLLNRGKRTKDQAQYYKDLANMFHTDDYTSNLLLNIKKTFPSTPYLLLLQASKYQVSSEYFKYLTPLGFDFPDQQLLGREIQDAVIDWAHKNSVEILDVLPAMQASQDKNFYHRIDDHYNAHGNEFVANQLAQYLENKLEFQKK